MINQIQQRFNSSLPISALFEGDTIAKMVVVLTEGVDHNDLAPLVPIQVSGELPPFFCIHPGGGDVLSYYSLAKHLGTDQPFYGIRSPGLTGGQEPFSSMEALTAHYLEAIQKVQPTGPYHLGGHSLGGVIALEIAQQLSLQGQVVHSLILIDSMLSDRRIDFTDSKKANAMILNDLVRWICSAINRASPVSFDVLLELELDEQLRYTVSQLRAVATTSEQLQVLFEEIDLNLIRRYFNVCKANIQMVQSYQAKPYLGKVLFLSAEESLDIGPQDLFSTWSEIFSGASEHVTIPGNHESLLEEPNVKLMAEKIKSYIKPPTAVEIDFESVLDEPHQ